MRVDKVDHPTEGAQNPMLTVEDNGGGMDPSRVRNCMSFGFSIKQGEMALLVRSTRQLCGCTARFPAGTDICQTVAFRISLPALTKHQFVVRGLSSRTRCRLGWSFVIRNHLRSLDGWLQ